MKQKVQGIMALACYTLGVLASIYVGAYRMLFCPIWELFCMYETGTFNYVQIAYCVIRIMLSTTMAGLVWCIGYIGFNHFYGKEDPNWDALEKRHLEEGVS